MKSDLILVGVDLEPNEIQACVNQAGFDLELQDFQQIPSFALSNFTFAKLVSELEKQGVSPKGPLVVVFHYYDQAASTRIYCDRINSIIGVNVYGLEDILDPSRVALLIYSAYTKSINGSNGKFSNHLLDHCFFRLPISEKSIPREICENCTKDLEEVEARANRVFRSIDSWLELVGCHHVLLVHGIETFGKWTTMAEGCLQNSHITAEKIDYGRFPVWRLFLHGFFRREIGSGIKEAYCAEKEKYPNKGISIICHSFGTLIVAYALLENPDVRIDKLILTGSIVSIDFPWQVLIDRGQVGTVLNECADNDYVVLLAEKYVYKCGASGVKGFPRVSAGPNVLNHRHKNTGHSGVLNTRSCGSRWVPFLAQGEDPYTAEPADPKLLFEWADRLLPKPFGIPALIFYGYLGYLLIG